MKTIIEGSIIDLEKIYEIEPVKPYVKNKLYRAGGYSFKIKFLNDKDLLIAMDINDLNFLGKDGERIRDKGEMDFEKVDQYILKEITTIREKLIRQWVPDNLYYTLKLNKEIEYDRISK